MDSVAGVFDPATRTVVVATSGLSSSVNLALHEIGHAYDFATKYLSGSGAFGAAYAAARGGLGSYYLQPGGAGLSEAFAESFAAHFSRNADYAKRHPSLNAYWEGRRR